VPARMKANGNVSDARLERLQYSVPASINCVNDAVELESPLIAILDIFELSTIWNGWCKTCV